MGTVQVRSLDQPDETRSFPNGVVEMLTIADTMIGRARFEYHLDQVAPTGSK
jgi:hypothetical protein